MKSPEEIRAELLTSYIRTYGLPSTPKAWAQLNEMRRFIEYGSIPVDTRSLLEIADARNNTEASEGHRVAECAS